MNSYIKKRKKGSSADSYYLFGFHSVSQALLNPKRKKYELWTTRNAREKLGSKMSLPKIPIHFLETVKGPLISKDSVHQGLILRVAPLYQKMEKEFLTKKCRNVVVILDKVTDPQNVGAIIRTSLFFDCLAVLNTERGGAKEGGSLVKSASGAFEKMPYILVTNISQTLRYMKKLGFIVVGLDSKAKEDIKSSPFSDLGTNIVLVFGAEGKGLRRLTLENCDYHAKISGKTDFSSLNVSTAVGITLHTILNSC